MNEHDALMSAAETIASNPKTASVISVTTTAMGIANTISTINSVLGTIAVIAGIIATIFVIRVNYINCKFLQKQIDKLDSENKND